MVAPRYLLDTNVLSEPIRPRPNAALMRRLDAHQERIATASIVIHELTYGLERLPPSRKRRCVEIYLDELLGSSLRVIPYDTEAAQWHARERARLERAGLTPSYRDAEIAAIARTRNLVLVTANVADFQHISGLEIENWMQE